MSDLHPPPPALLDARASAPIVLDGVRSDLVGDLRDAVLRLERSHASAPSLSRGGWKSGEILSWRAPCARALRDAVLDCVRVELGIRPAHLEGWAMVNRPRDHHPRHVHQGVAWSGVYYVDPGGEPHAPTVFEVDRDREVAVIPAPGRLVLFPGSMWHRVDRLDDCAGGAQAESPRVTIAFDVRR